MQQHPPFLLTPACFVAISANCRAVKGVKAPLTASYLLPYDGNLLDQEPFADIFMGWSQEGIGIEAKVHKPWQEAFYPELKKGDTFELFIDTRDRKEGGLTRFCHHFFFCAKPLENLLGAEISTFRDLDSHDLCDPKALEIEPKIGKEEYQLKIWIPAACLHGYDPASFNRLGFNYRLNRLKGDPQTFSISDRESPFEHYPAKWASLTLTP